MSCFTLPHEYRNNCLIIPTPGISIKNTLLFQKEIFGAKEFQYLLCAIFVWCIDGVFFSVMNNHFPFQAIATYWTDGMLNFHVSFKTIFSLQTGLQYGGKRDGGTPISCFMRG